MIARQGTQNGDLDWLYEWFNRTADRMIKEHRWDLVCQLELISSYFRDMGESPDRIVVNKFLDNINVSEEAVIIAYSVLERTPDISAHVVDAKCMSKKVLRCAVLVQDQKPALSEAHLPEQSEH